MRDYNSLEYKRSRIAYMTECTMEYFVTLVVTDAFFAKLLTSIGVSDALVGIISSFASLAFVIQLFSIFLIKTKISEKKLVMIVDTLSIFFFMMLYLVPFLSPHKSIRIFLIMICVFFAYVCKYLVVSVLFKWGNSFVDPTKRASFSATKEICSLIAGMVFTVIMGAIIDNYETLGNLEGGFLFMASAILILNICNFICFVLIKKDEPKSTEKDTGTIKDVIKNTLGNKNFFNVLIFSILVAFGNGFTIGFMGVFKTNTLAMSITLVQVVNIIAAFMRAVVSKPIGRYSDKNSFAKGYMLGLCLIACAYIVNIFTTNSTWWLIIIFTILYYCSLAGTNANSHNIIYSYVDSKYIIQAMAIKSSIAGLFGFFASILGGNILSAIQSNGNTLFGIKVYGQQVLSVISLMFTISAIIFIKKVIAKQKITIQ